MKESRSTILLIISMVLFILSFSMLFTWGYYNYFKPKPVLQSSLTLANDTSSLMRISKKIAMDTRDSLQKLYSVALQDLDMRLDASLHAADSIKAPLQVKLAEFDKLKNEIKVLLADKSKNADLPSARDKINLLQQKINELTGKNQEVEQENRRLYAMLKQLSGDKSGRTFTATKTNDVNSHTSKIIDTKDIPEISDLRLTALMITDDKELETHEALQADKFLGSMLVRYPGSQPAEVYIVVLQPDGKVLQKSVWESGTFQTAEGKKIYSCKMRFDAPGPEPRRLQFSIDTEKSLKGNYIMQVFHNGKLVGKLTKSLG